MNNKYIVRIIRTEEESELDKLATLFEKFEAFKPVLSSEHITLGLFDGEDIVGTVTAFKPEKVWMIEGLVIKPEYRRKGLGKKLGQEIAKKIKEAGATKTWVIIKDKNIASITLAKSFGFSYDDNQNEKEPFKDRSWYYLNL